MTLERPINVDLMVFKLRKQTRSRFEKLCIMLYGVLFIYGGQRWEYSDDASATCLMSHGHASSSIHHTDRTATWNLAVPRPFFFFIPHGSPWQLAITLRADKLPFKGGFFFSLSRSCHWLESFFFLLFLLFSLHFILCQLSKYSVHSRFLFTVYHLAPSSAGNRIFFFYYYFLCDSCRCVMAKKALLWHPGNGC